MTSSDFEVMLGLISFFGALFTGLLAYFGKRAAADREDQKKAHDELTAQLNKQIDNLQSQLTNIQSQLAKVRSENIELSQKLDLVTGRLDIAISRLEKNNLPADDIKIRLT